MIVEAEGFSIQMRVRHNAFVSFFSTSENRFPAFKLSKINFHGTI